MYILNCVLTSITLTVFFETWWFSASLVIITITVAIAVSKSKINKLKNSNGTLQQRVVECTEVLNYSKLNEEKAKEEVKLANKSKSLLLAKLSHEIRTPMNGVIGMASLLSETDLTLEQKEYADVIIQSSENLMTTINDMLVADVIGYSKMDVTEIELEYKDFDLRNMVEGVLESFAEKAAQYNVELIYEIDKDVPELIVSDEARLRQVLLNLVENAMRFTQKGEIFIAIKFLKSIDGNQMQLGFEIKDTGSSIPAKEIELIRKDIAEIDTKDEGNALALVISKKLVSLMEGKLDVESQTCGDHGNTIRFTIVTRSSLLPFRSNSKFDALLKGKKILLVDDNATIRSVLKKQFEQWYLLPTVAGSGKEALDILNKHQHFDLIITDLEMPDMDGIELASSIKKHNNSTSIILLNTTGDEQYNSKASYFNVILNKPLKQHLLYKYLAQELNKTNIVYEHQETKPKLNADLAKHCPLQILIVEDNKTNQQVAIKVLNKLGYQPELAGSGEEALEMVNDGKYDLIFMDVQMPGKDGMETTRMIRLCLNTQPVIVAMTANAIQGDKQKCLQAGMDDYISKPFKIEELTKVIEKWATQIRANK